MLIGSGGEGRRAPLTEEEINRFGEGRQSHSHLLLVVAIFGDVCTHGLLYSVGRLPDRATDRAAYNKPKVQKMTEITGLFEP